VGEWGSWRAGELECGGAGARGSWSVGELECGGAAPRRSWRARELESEGAGERRNRKQRSWKVEKRKSYVAEELWTGRAVRWENCGVGEGV